MTNISPLFGEMTPEDIASLMQREAQKFCAATYVALGREETFRAAVVEYRCVAEKLRDAGYEENVILPVLDVLAYRAVTWVRDKRVEMANYIVDELGLVGSHFRLIEIASESPGERKRREDRDWLKGYLASKHT